MVRFNVIAPAWVSGLFIGMALTGPVSWIAALVWVIPVAIAAALFNRAIETAYLKGRLDEMASITVTIFQAMDDQPQWWKSG